MQKFSSLFLGYDGYRFGSPVRHSSGLALALPPADSGRYLSVFRSALKRRPVERFAYSGYSPSADLLAERLRGWRHSSPGRYLRNLLFGFLPLLFLLASCSGGGGGGGGQSSLSVDLAFTPGDSEVTVNLVEKGRLVGLLNISTYQLTAIDSANETMKVEGNRLAEGTFNGSTLRGLTNDRNYTFALRVFYFPLGLAELSNLSLRIDYASVNAQNIRDAGGITIGSNRDGDYLADSVDADDDNDGLNDVDAVSGEALDDCPRGDTGWQSNNITDNDGDGCRDAGEDEDDDNDNVKDGEDDCDRGELGWRSNRTTDNDGDGCRDATEDEDDDNDMLADTEDLGQYNGRQCRLFADCDGDGLVDNEDLEQLNGRPCRVQPDCDGDTIADGEDTGEFMGTKCYLSRDCDKDGTSDLDDFGEHDGEPCRAKPHDCDEDTIADELDIDDDGDGLIEIGTAAELDAVRWVLNGSGRQLSETAVLNQTGCGDRNNGTACRGYELVRDIGLASYSDGDGWAPLGNDTNSVSFGCQGTAFSGVFDGNGFAVRELNINLGGETCIGLFGHLAASAVIRNLIVDAKMVIGSNFVGGLAGSAASAKIVSSYVVTAEVKGDSYIGGLVGDGQNAKITSSSSVTGKVSGINDFIGGLVGYGQNAEIVSSFSVAGEVRGNDNAGDGVGGLMGDGQNAEIVSSYSVAGVVRGDDDIGGLVGDGQNAEIVSSYSVAGMVRGDDDVGGLVGGGGDIDSSYWHTAAAVTDNDKGEEKTLAELRKPTNDNAYDTGGIYANWMRGADIDDTTGMEDITIYCDEDLSGDIETDERRDGSGSGGDNRIWDFGEADDYPAIRCPPLSLAEQRSWWFINSTGYPNLNQTRLDARTSP